jgi:hypothetical protein
MPDNEQTLGNANPPEGEVKRGLTINDMLTVVQLIQLSSQRGTWRAEELSTVGTLYDNVTGFLEAAGALQKAPTPSASDAPAAGGEPQPGEENTNA